MMVKNRHVARRRIPEVAFAAPVGTPATIEVMSLADLRTRIDGRHLGQPQRPAFHHLLALTGGSLRHIVDFTDYALTPGMWLWLRPGQVHQWGDLTQAEGTLILFEPDFPDPATADIARLDDVHTSPVWTATGEDLRALTAATDHLRHEFNALGRLPLEAHIAALRHLLAVLLLRLTHLTSPAGALAPETEETYLRFRDAVERGFPRSHKVEDYARTLGYSPRTLSRATLATAGIGAKEFIDRRIILEAKRLLAHGDQPAAHIAAQLGFSSPTNFSKYFHHRTGTTPIAFRTAIRRPAPER
ncbi:AraC family transcriptional regulator [Streptosporangium sp. NPDC006013]|uniref:helix-turn-helix domain-containing protein n=1 Tax=Streptosporangium sp. NPDC006013 TaxID=3155596 RepID=UPI0033A85301